MNLQNSLLKKTTAGLFTAATVLTMAAASTTVLATEINEDGTFYNTGNDMNITLKKTLNFSEGVTLPTGKDNDDLWFAFQITPKDSTVNEAANMPKLKTTTVTDSKGNVFENVVKIGGFKNAADGSGSDLSQEETGVITLASDDIIDDSQFTRAGEYVYKVKELGSSNFLANKEKENATDDWFKDSMTYDDTELELHIFVKNKNDGTKDCYVSHAYFTKCSTPDNSNVGGDDNNTKNETSSLCDGTEKTDKVQPIFSNTYVKEAGKNPNANNSKSSLGITKTVSGEYADKGKFFDFTVTVQELASEEVLKQVIKEASADNNPWSSITKIENGKITELTAYVQDIENCIVDPREDKTAKKVTLTLDENGYFTGTFSLQDGQYLTFVSLPAGFKYKVTETYSKNYTASAKLFENIDLRHSNTNPISTDDERGIKADGWADGKGKILNPVQQRLYTIVNGGITVEDGEGNHSHPVWIDKDSANTTIVNLTAQQGEDLSTDKSILIGEHDNSLDVTNTFDDTSITKTGLIVKNLPFIVMIALGVLAFLGLTKKRRAND